MPTIEEAINQLRENPQLIADPGFQATFASLSNTGQQQGEQEQQDPNALYQQLMQDPKIANHPLNQLLAKPEFYNWFKENYPNEQYPPSPQDMRSYWDTYEKAGGDPWGISVGGYDLTSMRNGKIAKFQGEPFNNAMSQAFAGNPPMKADIKKKGFNFKLDQNKQLRAFGKGVKNIVNAAKGPVLGGPSGPLAENLGITGGGGLGGQKERVDRFPLLTPMQEKATNQLLTEGMKNTSWAPIEQQARENFYTKTAPTLAERFNVMTGPQSRSSAVAPAIMSAGGELERGLAGLKSQYGMRQLGMGLQPKSFENVFRPGQPGLGQQIAGGAAQFLPFLAMKAMGI